MCVHVCVHICVPVWRVGTLTVNYPVMGNLSGVLLGNITETVHTNTAEILGCLCALSLHYGHVGCFLYRPRAPHFFMMLGDGLTPILPYKRVFSHP